MLLKQILKRSFSHSRPEFHATTVLNVRKGDQVALIADGKLFRHTSLTKVLKKLKEDNNVQ